MGTIQKGCSPSQYTPSQKEIAAAAGPHRHILGRRKREQDQRSANTIFYARTAFLINSLSHSTLFTSLPPRREYTQQMEPARGAKSSDNKQDAGYSRRITGKRSSVEQPCSSQQLSPAGYASKIDGQTKATTKKSNGTASGDV